MNNTTLQALDAIRRTIAKSSMQFKSGIEGIDAILTDRLLKKFDFSNNTFFQKGNQQSVENLDREVFIAAKELDLLSARSTGKFNYRYSASFSEDKKREAARETKDVIKKYIQSRGIVLKAQDYTTDVVEVAVNRIVNAGFVAEPDREGAINFRQLKKIEGVEYWSDVHNGERVIQDFIKIFIDDEATELKQAEIESNLRAESRRLAGVTNTESNSETLAGKRQETNSKDQRYYELLKKRNNDLKFLRTIEGVDQISNDKRTEEFTNLFYFKLGYPDSSIANMTDQRNAKRFADEKIKELTSYEVPALIDADKIYLNYAKVVKIPY